MFADQSTISVSVWRFIITSQNVSWENETKHKTKQTNERTDSKRFLCFCNVCPSVLCAILGQRNVVGKCWMITGEEEKNTAKFKTDHWSLITCSHVARCTARILVKRFIRNTRCRTSCRVSHWTLTNARLTFQTPNGWPFLLPIDG